MGREWRMGRATWRFRADKVPSPPAMDDADALAPADVDDFRKRISGLPPAEQLAAQSLPAGWDGGALLAQGKTARGVLTCNSPGLQGPPGRVHGGYHGVLR